MFERGDQIQTSQAYREEPRSGRKRGIFLGVAKDGFRYRVLWEKAKHPDYIAPQFVEPLCDKQESQMQHDAHVWELRGRIALQQALKAMEAGWDVTIRLRATADGIPGRITVMHV